MDEVVKTSTKRSAGLDRAAGLAALLALCSAAGAAGAGTASSLGLQDPTRPPAAALAGQVPAGAPEAQAAPQLQSVMLGALPGVGRVAVIDGESVRVGERFRGARVVRIADNEVELQRGAERQVLRLYAPPAGAGMTRVGPAAQRREKGER